MLFSCFCLVGYHSLPRLCKAFLRSASYKIKTQTDCPLLSPSVAPSSKRQLPWVMLEIPPATQAISRAFVTTLGNLFFYSLSSQWGTCSVSRYTYTRWEPTWDLGGIFVTPFPQIKAAKMTDWLFRQQS